MIGDAPASISINRTPPATGSLSQPVSTSPTTGTSDIPAAALAAYQHGAQVINSVADNCHLNWTLIAAIGSVESDHGRANGNTLTAVNATPRPENQSARRAERSGCPKRFNGRKRRHVVVFQHHYL